MLWPSTCQERQIKLSGPSCKLQHCMVVGKCLRDDGLIYTVALPVCVQGHIHLKVKPISTQHFTANRSHAHGFHRNSILPCASKQTTKQRRSWEGSVCVWKGGGGILYILLYACPKQVKSVWGTFAMHITKLPPKPQQIYFVLYIPCIVLSSWVAWTELISIKDKLTFWQWKDAVKNYKHPIYWVKNYKHPIYWFFYIWFLTSFFFCFLLFVCFACASFP